MKQLLNKQITVERVYILMNFLTVVKNKKEKTAERGAVYKSITICSWLEDDLNKF